MVPLVNYKEVKAATNNPEIYIIDVRDPSEIKKTGAIPNSINIPLNEIEAALDKSDNDFKAQFKRAKPQKHHVLVFSCLVGGRAEDGAKKAIAKGFSSAKVYRGSWQDWAQQEKR